MVRSISESHSVDEHDPLVEETILVGLFSKENRRWKESRLVLGRGCAGEMVLWV